jgi:hypothetical protein
MSISCRKRVIASLIDKLDSWFLLSSGGGEREEASVSRMTF